VGVLRGQKIAKYFQLTWLAIRYIIERMGRTYGKSIETQLEKAIAELYLIKNRRS